MFRVPQSQLGETVLFVLFQTQAVFTRKISRGIRAIISLLPANPPVVIADNLEHYRQALSKKPNISLAVLTNVSVCVCVCVCCNQTH